MDATEWAKIRLGPQNAAQLIVEAHRTKKWTINEMEMLLEEINEKLCSKM